MKRLCLICYQPPKPKNPAPAATALPAVLLVGNGRCGLLADLDGQGEGLTLTINAQGELIAGGVVGYYGAEVALAAYLLSVNGGDYIVCLKSCFVGRASLGDGCNRRTGRCAVVLASSLTSATMTPR